MDGIGPNKSRVLSEALYRNHNNYDFLRLLLASLVILGHSGALSPAPGYVDPVSYFIGFDYSGGVAVAMFFCLSGLFVANSAFSGKPIFEFAITRLFRIYPGLIACLFITTFVIGPLFTELSLIDYFRNPQTLKYFNNNIELTYMEYWLPRVFLDNKGYGINGSIWTLPIETRLYVAVGIVAVAGLAGKRLIGGSAVICACLVFLGLNNYIEWVNPTGAKLVMCFACGVIFAIYKDIVPISATGLFVLVAFALLCWNSPLKQPLFYLSTFYFCIFFFQLPSLNKFVLSGDASYGVYVYGFVIQQTFADVFPSAGPTLNVIVCLPIAIGVGFLSWHYLERPSLRVAKELCGLSHFRQLEPRLFVRPAIFVTVIALAPQLIQLIPDFGKIEAAEFDLRIVDFGPRQVEHGHGFNIQPNGSSAMWVHVSRPAAAEVDVVLGGRMLKGDVRGDLITTQVPGDLYSRPGNLTLFILEENARRPTASPSMVMHID